MGNQDQRLSEEHLKGALQLTHVGHVLMEHLYSSQIDSPLLCIHLERL